MLGGVLTSRGSAKYWPHGVRRGYCIAKLKQFIERPNASATKYPGAKRTNTREQSNQIPGSVSDQIPGSVSDQIPGSVSDQIPGSKATKYPGAKQPNTRERQRPNTRERSDQIPESVSDQIPGSVSDQIPESVSDQIPGSEATQMTKSVATLMTKLLIEKELKNLLLSPKFTATFLATTVLVLLSIQAGIVEYKNGKKQYEAASSLVQQELNQAERWQQVGGRQRVFREPRPMQIFVSGVHFDIGRYSVISSWQDIRLRQSAYSIEPIFAVFRALDFIFIVQIVLSLITIVFTYDLICGEKESGTLRLMLSNSVPRTSYITAKAAGAWLGLMVPLLIPLGLGLLLVQVQGIPMSASDWGNLAVLTGYSVLYLTAFVCLGVLVSTLTHRSSISFLLLLVFWIVMVLVVPRGGMMIASQIHDVPTSSEIEAQKEGFARTRRMEFFEANSEIFQRRAEATRDMSEEERQAYNEENEWQEMLERDELQQEMDADISDFNRKIDEEAANKRGVQQRLGFALSRFSPASAFQLAGMTLGQTDVDLKLRYLLALNEYRTVFRNYIDAKDPGGPFSFGSSSEAAEPLDLSDLPVFEAPESQEPIQRTLHDALVLVLYASLSLAVSFIAFNRYDVR